MIETNRIRGRWARGVRAVCVSVGLALCLTALPSPAAAEEAALTVFRQVRVFDGETVLPKVDVLVEGARIAAVGENLPSFEGARVVDGTGKTLLPGFIDCHTHAFGPALARALQFGVTTELDMFTDHRMAAGLRRAQSGDGVTDRADLFSAGTLATAPGGHGTQFGMHIPTLESPDEAEAWVEARMAEGSDYIKVVREDGSLYGGDIPSLSAETAAAVIAAANARDLLTVVHVSAQSAAREATRAGANGLAHLFVDQAADPAWVEEAAKAGMFVIPTMTVLESGTGGTTGLALVDDPHLGAYLQTDEIRSLRSHFPSRGALDFGDVLTSVSRLANAGVPVLAGTDAPNPGTAHGVSMHRELELLVQAGLTPAAALAAATSVPADVFGLDDRGRIAPGLLADLVLVAGDPTEDIRATRAIEEVLRRGQTVERKPIERAEERPSGETPEAFGLVSDFESGEMEAVVGSGWSPSTDGIRGGSSTVELSIAGEGAGESAHSLEVGGELREGFAFRWAGAFYSPGDVPMSPVDASGADTLVFQIRGDGKPVTIMLFAESLGMVPAQTVVETTDEWVEHRLGFEKSFGIDGIGLMGVLFSGREGTFRFWVDDLAFEVEE